MKIPNKLPDVEYLRECFTYDATTGALYWNSRPERHFANRNTSIMWNSKFAFRRVGTVDSKGHAQVKIDKKLYQMHRVIWKLHYGKDPAVHVDHIDHNRLNNKISNLREVTHQENHKNQSLRSTNTSGVTGVGWYKKYNKWNAYIRADKGHINLGYFDQIEDAVIARKAAEKALGYHKNHGSNP